jgi:tetratricopeptide (TPR) repeat protein
MLPALLWLSPAGARSQPSQSAASAAMERDFQAAMAAEDRGDMERAQVLLSKLHNEHPGIFAVDESLGLLYARREDFRRALPLLQAAAGEQPSSDAAHANLGATLYRLHRSREALDEFERAVHINPGNASAQESLGRLWMENRKPGEAAKAFTAALRLRPADPDLQLDCVTALLAADRLDEARKILSTFADPDQSARAQSLLGETDEKAGKFQSAAKHFARAVELEPNEENAWQLGLEFLRHWTFSAAVTEFEAASARFPDSKRLRLGLGAALFGNAQYPKAVPVFADLLATDPNNSLYAELLGLACDAPAYNISPRCGELVAYAQAHPTNAQAAAYAASFLTVSHPDTEGLATARKLLARAIAADPNQPDAQYEMGVVLQDCQDWKASIPYLEHAVKLKPDFAIAHYHLARAYWKTGRRQDGQAQLQLQQKFVHQQQQDLDHRLRQITRFIVNIQQ